jgi:hypothetical protein
MKKLELVVLLNRSKRKEFKQSLQFLKDKIADFSTSFDIDELEDALSFSLLVQWETDVQMNKALQSDEFKILSGAINSLCEKTIIRLDDKQVGNHISNLASIIQAKL